jgi:putative sporulation protein YtaF
MHTTQLVTIGLLAISCNLDNIGVGLAYGARGIGIPLVSNLMIAMLTAAGTGICIVFGQKIFHYLPAEVGVFLGAVLLIGMGAWVLWQEFGARRDEPHQAPPKPQAQEMEQMPWLRRLIAILQKPVLADNDASGQIDVKESVLLSMALMLNNLPNGVGAGLLGLSILGTTLLVGLLSVVTFWVGISLGRTMGVHWLGRHAGTIAGTLLILIGVAEIILTLPI